MFDFTSGWIICVTLIAIVGAVFFVTRGATMALGAVAALSFAAPVWLEIPIAGVSFSVQTSIAAIFLLAFAIRSPWEIRSPIVLLDVIVAGLVILQICSDTYHGQSVVQAGFLGYGEWALPYVAGRFALRDPRNIEPLAYVLSGIVIVLGVGSVLESCLKINPWELIFGERPLDGVPRDGSRFGLKRAYGTTLHPIFFGLLILVLIPWTLALQKWAQNATQRGLGVAGTIIGSLGVLGSVSRAPALGLVILYTVFGLIWWKSTRWVLVIFLALGIGWASFDFNGMTTVFEQLGGEKRHKTNLALDGERVELSSAAHRIVMWQVYWPAMKEAGVLGYGSQATSDLPPKVPYLPKDEHTRQKLRFVDNAYLMFGLRFGWTGMVLYSLLLVGAAWTGFRLLEDRSVGVIAAGMVAMTVALALNMITVWFSYDMGFEALWSFGVLAGLSSSQRS